jgi:hypothetical protein
VWTKIVARLNQPLCSMVSKNWPGFPALAYRFDPDPGFLAEPQRGN